MFSRNVKTFSPKDTTPDAMSAQPCYKKIIYFGPQTPKLLISLLRLSVYNNFDSVIIGF